MKWETRKKLKERPIKELAKDLNNLPWPYLFLERKEEENLNNLNQENKIHQYLKKSIRFIQIYGQSFIYALTPTEEDVIIAPPVSDAAALSILKEEINKLL